MNTRRLQLTLVIPALLGSSTAPAQPAEQIIDLRAQWDETTPLANPHKGWYHHYPDNHIRKYEIPQDDDLLKFPGMDHLYIRLAWAYLEPQEGRFNWPVIDDLIRKWTGHGLGIAFRISCRETSTDRIEQQFATPRWVMEAGAKGGHFLRGKETGPDGPWEPVFDDPVFLAKLEQFLVAFAARYDGKPWLRYVDIGSVGDWGEGHTHSGSRREYNFETLKRHVDLHLKFFTKSQLVISDDFVYSLRDAQDRQRLHRYVIAHGISYRDDSILVDGYLAGHSGTFTVRSPEFFADTYRKRPTVLELEHYGSVKRAGNWDARTGSSLAKHGGGRTGADFFRGALDLLHATYIGYHGYAAEWLADNPALTGELLNRCGYWYFLSRARLPSTLVVGQPAGIELEWINRGVAPAYQAYRLHVRLEGSDKADLDLDSRNQAWSPSADVKSFPETYRLNLPPSLKPGSYVLKLKLRCPATSRDVQIALRGDLRDSAGYYRIATVEVRAAAASDPGPGTPPLARAP
jgi:hypothetical protein